MAAVGIVCGLLSKYWSSDKDGTNKQNQNAYTTACEEDPKLKSYGSLFEQRFNKLKSELAAGGKTENYSLNSVKSLCGFLVEMNEDMAEEITASKDVLENEELRSLVDLYYESSTKTLDLFNTVEKCTKKAKLSFLIVKVAIKKFEKESMDDTDFEGNLKKKKKKYAETLVELNKVKAMGDPFGDEYKNQLESVRSEHLVLLKKIHELLVKIDKKKAKLKRRRRLVAILYASAALTFMAVETYVCIAFVPPLAFNTAITAATGLNYMIGTAGILINEVMKNRERDLDRQKELVKDMENKTTLNIQGTDTVNSLVEKLIGRLSLILDSVDVAAVNREEEAVKLVMEEIVSEVTGFAEVIKEVGEAVATCSTCVAAGKVQILEHITKSMSSKGKK
ncbi:UPF0496 protein [Raphanus sativus]|uniref:UPF0496 protein At5g66670-like n=1 Tax=Raphanus sativus TaxID=3726 RepID=A0A9W3CKR1_RAPSA|nr:UPF0496 protein At5g66670-like [Raphanus sativus]XP_056852213.1 UPF0496 protein At5g66670-like [Raphanus sativus]KAJ4873201.1 UPF0496 protein [Raphanus sativus]